MFLSPFDTVVILVFIFLGLFIYKRTWFSSFYSFIKFLLSFIVSLVLALIISEKIPFAFFITKLQLSLVIQAVIFVGLWKILSFKKIFFGATDGILGINRFLFVHRVDRILSLLPAFLVSLFISFFLFSVAVSASTSYSPLQEQIERSKIVRPLFYKIYFANIVNGFGLFENVAYKLVPQGNQNGTNSGDIKQGAIDSFQKLVNDERQKIGLTPLVYMGVPSGQNPFIEPTPIPKVLPLIPTVTPPPPTPTRVIIRIPFVRYPTSAPPPTASPNSNLQPTPALIVVTATPTPAPFIPVATPIPSPTQAPSAPTINTSQAEQDIFRLTNEQRTANGVAPLVWSDAIASVARAHSQDMVTRNFFSHVNPDGLDPFQRMTIGGISYTAAAENIAGAATADIIVSKWMNSPGHRANILNPAFGKLGVGVVVSPIYGLMATQDFTN